MQKIMINTPLEVIKCRDARKGQKAGPQAKTPIAVINGYAPKRAQNGRRLGIKCPVLAARRQPCAARNPCFLEESRNAAPIHLRAARGNINESAEILITAAVAAVRNVVAELLRDLN